MALEEYPSGVCTLVSLEELGFGGCKSLKMTREGLGDLALLKEVDMQKCEDLEELPS